MNIHSETDDEKLITKKNFLRSRETKRNFLCVFFSLRGYSQVSTFPEGEVSMRFTKCNNLSLLSLAKKNAIGCKARDELFFIKKNFRF